MSVTADTPGIGPDDESTRSPAMRSAPYVEAERVPCNRKETQLRIRIVIMPLLVAACVAATSMTGPTHAESAPRVEPNHTLVDKIVVASDRYAPEITPDLNKGEIYLLALDGSDVVRLTDNSVFDGFGALSPDGKKIVFVSNRIRQPGEPVNTSALFVMNTDGSEQTFLARGGSPTWSPDSKHIAFQASASGIGNPINGNPDAATEDSDIFIANLDDLLEHGTPPQNLTNDPTTVDDDPDWSPDGNTIVHTSHDAAERPTSPPFVYRTAEVYLRAADGTGTVERLTFNDIDDRSPDWSHDGERIAFSCVGQLGRHEMCVRDALGVHQLTSNGRAHLSPAWSPDDQRLYFNSNTQGTTPDGTTLNRNQIWWVAADGTHEQLLVPFEPTSTIGPNVGVLRVKTDN